MVQGEEKRSQGRVKVFTTIGGERDFAPNIDEMFEDVKEIMDKYGSKNKVLGVVKGFL